MSQHASNSQGRDRLMVGVRNRWRVLVDGVRAILPYLFLLWLLLELGSQALASSYAVIPIREQLAPAYEHSAKRLGVRSTNAIVIGDLAFRDYGFFRIIDGNILRSGEPCHNEIFCEGRLVSSNDKCSLASKRIGVRWMRGRIVWQAFASDLDIASEIPCGNYPLIRANYSQSFKGRIVESLAEIYDESSGFSAQANAGQSIGLPRLIRIETYDDQGEALNPESRFAQQVIGKALAEGLCFAIWIACCVIGLWEIKFEVPRQPSANGAVWRGVAGVVLIVSRQWFLWLFLTPLG
jgi:hypothetical protein